MRGQLIVIENVPAGVCPQCGGKVVTTEVGRRIATLLENPKKNCKRPENFRSRNQLGCRNRSNYRLLTTLCF
ncbi:YgiT-type zinc finger protein [candidate division KSB1 bacterium]|nr:MAG: YgiT-type zinc finger protein [candidate division KSB1 bacterium]MBC6950107.1 YgiT-type zinc finger protein [candidate division KSB1 bacterium]MCE7941160.1 YgiT-type zinc finger protein [Chlorobi bacterium CHB1]MDL1876870.1 YgiT-type zinc finger protein [Cytophagia bacterium CHB2]